MRVAAIDCGTNSIRLLVAEAPAAGSSAGPLVDVLRRNEIVRLGQGVDATGVLAPQAIERTRLALVDYAAEIERLGVTATRMVATSATRDARNRADFVAMVNAVLGIDPEVATGDEEAALSFTGATRGLPFAAAEEPLLVIDLGGGSTELVLGSDGRVTAGRSVDIGCVRLTERHQVGDLPSAAVVEAVEREVRAALAVAGETVDLAAARTVVGLAGTFTTITALALGLPTYDAELVHRARVTRQQAADVAAMLLGSTRAEREANPVIHPGRVDVITTGSLVVRTILDVLGVEGYVTSERDILDGIAWSVIEASEKEVP